MPKTKRKAPTTAQGVSRPKRVRVRAESVTGEPDTTPKTTAAGQRAKRASTGEKPQYVFTRTRPGLTAAQKAENDATTEAAPPVRRSRGRPPKAIKDEVDETPATPLETAQEKKPSPGKQSVRTKRKSRTGPRKSFIRTKTHTTSQSAKSTGRGAVKRVAASPKTAKAASPTRKATKMVVPVRKGPGRPKKTPPTIISLGDIETNSATDDETTEAEQDGNYSGRQYFLMKAEPDSRIEKGRDVKFSIDDLQAAEEPEAWDGVRNFVARNVMRAMRKGDLAFFYHSNCSTPGIVGVLRIVREHSTDESAFDSTHPYYDPKSSRDNPRWDVVHVEFVKKFDEIISLKELKSYAEKGGVLEDMQTLKQSRLSVSFVKPKEWEYILGLTGEVDLEERLEEE